MLKSIAPFVGAFLFLFEGSLFLFGRSNAPSKQIWSNFGDCSFKEALLLPKEHCTLRLLLRRNLGHTSTVVPPNHFILTMVKLASKYIRLKLDFGE